MEKKIYRATRRNSLRSYRVKGFHVPSKMETWREMQQKSFSPRKALVVNQYQRLHQFVEAWRLALPLTWHHDMVQRLAFFWRAEPRTRPVSRIIRELKAFDNDPQRRYTNSALVAWANQVRRGLKVNSLEALAGTPEKI